MVLDMARLEALERLVDLKAYNKNYFINSSRIIKDYDLFFLLQYLNHKDRYSNYPKFNFEKSIKYIENGDELPLVIIFQGFYEAHISSYYQEDVELKKLDTLNETKLDYAFSSFIKNNTNFNYICVKDNFQSWYTINFDLYLKHIVEFILKKKPKSVYTVGSSAGGFASILFGHYVHADKAIAYSPQIVGFYHFMNNYRRQLNSLYRLSQLTFTDLSFIQKINYGFNCDVDITLCKSNSADLEEFQLLNANDYTDITINLIDGSSHNIFEVIDKNKEFNRLVSIIKK